MTCEEDTSLPPAYGEALRRRAAGESDEAIAAALDVAVEAVPALLLLAERKIAGRDPDPDPDL
jgi:hypothetical protein